MKKLFSPLFLGLIGVSLLSSCASRHEDMQSALLYEQSASTRDAKSSSEMSTGASSQASKGLIGTQHGTEEHAYVERVDFVRLNTKPDALLVLDYRDEDKVDKGNLAEVDSLTDNKGIINVRFLSDKWFSSTFPTYLRQTGRPMLLGERGEHYVIELENRLDSAVEVVISIDGLNTTTNKAATYASRGYVIGPKEKVAVRGWMANQSYGSYRFKFSDIDSTVAATRNNQETVPDIGTMGFAIFKSKASVNAGTRGRAFADQ